MLLLGAAAAANVSNVAILTPVSKTHAERHGRYVRNVLSLSDLVRETCRVAFLSDRASMPIVSASKRELDAAGFGSVVVIPDTGRAEAEVDRERRHEPRAQRYRRSRLALARNKLVFTALGLPFLGVTIDLTLWLDSDLQSLPPLLVSRLLEAKADVVAPLVLDPNKVVYDKNSWQHSDASRAALAALPPGSLCLQGGYRTPTTVVISPDGDERTQRDLGIRHMAALAEAGDRFPALDAVGTACLLVDARVYARADFPSKVTGHLLESEGFGALAASKGFRVVADVETAVVHA